jgi:hypothetical protein
MAKKCIPGVICIENMTLAIILFLLVIVAYLWIRVSSLGNNSQSSTIQSQSNSVSTPTILLSNSVSRIPIQDVRGDVGRCNGSGNGTIGDPLSNAYVPPIKCDAGSLMIPPTVMNIPSNAVPINIPTQSYNTQYSQVGILTKQYGSKHDILPLMGRRTITSRDKWQYYTVSGGGAGGNLQAKLPVKVKNRNCSSEYGCEEIHNGDDVYVEGYQETFRATIYESGLFSYIPY